MTNAARNSLRFTHLCLTNWRNFLTVDTPLQERAFLVGPNASGKSNLLDVFRFLRDIVTIGGGFQEALRKRGGVSSLRCLAARRNPSVELEVAVGTHEQPQLWEYELHFNQTRNDPPVITREAVRHEGSTIRERPTDQDAADPARLTQTDLEQVTANKDFRPLVEFFSELRYLHVVPQLIRDPDRSTGRTNDPFGGDFLQQMAKTTKRIQESRLRKIRDALHVAVPQLAELEMSRDERGTPHLRGRYEHWRPQGAWQTEERFSDGTLRLLGLLWSVLDGTGPLLLEEPELSLHPEVVRHIPGMLARIQRKTGRQIILSTHSSDLLQDEGIGLDEVLLLLPSAEGTEVKPARSITDVATLLDNGVPLPDIVMPRTRPPGAQLLLQFEG